MNIIKSLGTTVKHAIVGYTDDEVDTYDERDHMRDMAEVACDTNRKVTLLAASTVLGALITLTKLLTKDED